MGTVMATKVLLCVLLGSAVSKPVSEADLRLRRSAEVKEDPSSFRLGPVRIRMFPFDTRIKIVTGLIMSIVLIQFMYSSVRKRTQESEKPKYEINTKIYTICPKSRT